MIKKIDWPLYFKVVYCGWIALTLFSIDLNLYRLANPKPETKVEIPVPAEFNRFN